MSEQAWVASDETMDQSKGLRGLPDEGFHTRLHTYIHAYIHTYIHACMHAHTHTHTCSLVHIGTRRTNSPVVVGHSSLSYHGLWL